MLKNDRYYALKPTHEAGRRGGDSIARWRGIYFISFASERVVMAFCGMPFRLGWVVGERAMRRL